MKMLPKEDYFSRALYTFDIGQNDLTAGYKLNMTIEQVKAYVPDVLGQFSNVIKVQLFFILLFLLSENITIDEQECYIYTLELLLINSISHFDLYSIQVKKECYVRANLTI